jgi:hypothetical protein
MLLRATINITDEEAQYEVPHMGSRFFGADGLASSEAPFAEMGASLVIESVAVTVPANSEPGQVITITHAGREVEVMLPQTEFETGDTVLVDLAVPRSRGISNISLSPPPSSPPASLAQLPAPVINIHGRRLERTWSLLAHTAPESATQLALKDDPHAMGSCDHGDR